MNVNEVPDISKMTVDEAKVLIIDNIKSGNRGDAHDFAIGSVVRNLLKAQELRNRAAQMLSGSNVMHYGGREFSETAPLSSVIYDAVWELVYEGILRPGPRHWDVLNADQDGFCLTRKGRESLGGS